MPKNKLRRDPTAALVLAILLVLASVVVITRLGGPDDQQPTAGVPMGGAPTSGAPSTTSPDSLPSTTTTLVPKPPSVFPLAASGPTTCVQEYPPTDLTVVSYNIKSGHGGGTLPQIAAALRASDADVVLFQEINSYPGGTDMPAYFASALGFGYHEMGVNVLHGRAPYGTAIVSRYPIVSWTNTHLPDPPGTQQRGLLHAIIDVNHTEVSLYDTHLENTSEGARIQQMNAILSIVAQDPRPQIFGGDMNSQPNSRPSAMARTHFSDTWAAVGVGTGRTHPANHLRGRIDYLYDANAGITPLFSDVLPQKLSDHMAVRARYRVDGSPQKICIQSLHPVRPKASTKSR